MSTTYYYGISSIYGCNIIRPTKILNLKKVSMNFEKKNFVKYNEYDYEKCYVSNIR